MQMTQIEQPPPELLRIFAESVQADGRPLSQMSDRDLTFHWNYSLRRHAEETEMLREKH